MSLDYEIYNLGDVKAAARRDVARSNPRSGRTANF
jgi:hypothetical protein